MPITRDPAPRQLAARITAAAALTLSSALANAQALQEVVDAANIAQDTALAVAAAIITVSWAVAGYQMAFNGASFRDVSAKVLGGAVAGGAAGIAAMFM